MQELLSIRPETSANHLGIMPFLETPRSSGRGSSFRETERFRSGQSVHVYPYESRASLAHTSHLKQDLTELLDLSKQEIRWTPKLKPKTRAFAFSGTHRRSSPHASG